MMALERLADRLETLCDWRDQIETQIRRAELLFELGLLDDAVLKKLTRRVRLWCDTANTLAASLSERGLA
jgi:hypothetical protein